MHAMQASLSGDLSNAVTHVVVQSCCAVGSASTQPHSGSQVRSALSATVCTHPAHTITPTLARRGMAQIVSPPHQARKFLAARRVRASDRLAAARNAGPPHTEGGGPGTP